MPPLLCHTQCVHSRLLGRTTLARPDDLAGPGPTFRPCLGANRGGQRAHREVHKTVRHEHAHDTLVIQIAAQSRRACTFKGSLFFAWCRSHEANSKQPTASSSTSIHGNSDSNRSNSKHRYVPAGHSSATLEALHAVAREAAAGSAEALP